jgi:toxin ParE1/3/4
LAEIAAYLIGEASEEIAHRIVSDIAARIGEIREFPEAGARRDHILPGVRVVIKHNYVTYYRLTPTEIVVLAVLHGSRDVEAIVSEGGFESTQ